MDLRTGLAAVDRVRPFMEPPFGPDRCSIHEHGAVIHRGCTTTLRRWSELWNQRLGQRPQLIAHQPA